MLPHPPNLLCFCSYHHTQSILQKLPEQCKPHTILFIMLHYFMPRTKSRAAVLYKFLKKHNLISSTSFSLAHCVPIPGFLFSLCLGNTISGDLHSLPPIQPFLKGHLEEAYSWFPISRLPLFLHSSFLQKNSVWHIVLHKYLLNDLKGCGQNLGKFIKIMKILFKIWLWYSHFRKGTATSFFLSLKKLMQFTIGYQNLTANLC